MTRDEILAELCEEPITDETPAIDRAIANMLNDMKNGKPNSLWDDMTHLDAMYKKAFYQEYQLDFEYSPSDTIPFYTKPDGSQYWKSEDLTLSTPKIKYHSSLKSSIRHDYNLVSMNNVA